MIWNLVSNLHISYRPYKEEQAAYLSWYEVIEPRDHSLDVSFAG